MRNAYKILVGEPGEKDFGVCEMIILEWILEK